MKELHVEGFDAQTRHGRYRRSCVIRRVDGTAEVDRRTLWFEFDGWVPPPATDDAEAFLLCVLLDAMRERREIHVHGTASRRLLGNLVEFRDAWCTWLPALYAPVPIHAGRIAPAAHRGDPERAVCAFSGGVDATFSLWRHHRGLVEQRSRTPAACAIVQGFDLPLDRSDAFETAHASAQAVLASIGVPMVAVRTNCREVVAATWEHNFAAALVGALLNLRSLAGNCVVGSSEPYDHLVLPWGSSPVTDALLSSDGFEVMHDGAAHSRTSKVAALAAWPEAAAALRVCWEGDVTGRNCGVCEKCLRTKYNFLANGLAPAPRFDDATRSLAGLRLRNQPVRTEWETMLGQARLSAEPATVREIEKLLAPPALPRRVWNRLRRETRGGMAALFAAR